MSTKFHLTLENYIKTYLQKNQGFRLGETTVVSQKVHRQDPHNPSRIRVLTDLDAGVHYLNLEEEGKVMHIDVFHGLATLDPVLLGRRIWESIKEFLIKEYKYGEDLTFTDDMLRKANAYLGKRIIISTGNGHGSVYDLASRRVQKKKKPQPQSHVHVLAEIPPELNQLVSIVAESIESAVLRQGAQIRRIDQVVNCESDDECAKSIKPLILPLNKKGNEWQIYKQNRWQVMVGLVNSLGSIEEVKRFLETISSQNNVLSSIFGQKHNDIERTLQNLTERQVVKKGRFSYTLTEEGNELLKHIQEHQSEIEAQIRKSIRQVPKVSKRYQTFRHSDLRSPKKKTLEKKKVLNMNEHNWLGNIAIPETVVSAVTRNFLEKKRPLTRITRKDIRIYDHDSYAPVDTCLVLDCSGSMVGAKIRAVSYLAEHLLLATRERVAVVAFQEMNARVVSPFTRNYYELQKGLRSIVPEGLTPMAKGVVEALDLINKQKARNALLVLITDGLPNFPHWTTNATKDALRAAEMIAEQKIRFTCIGVEAYKEFLTEMTEKAKGNLYIVEDDFEKNSLIDIVQGEWQTYKSI